MTCFLFLQWKNRILSEKVRHYHQVAPLSDFQRQKPGRAQAQNRTHWSTPSISPLKVLCCAISWLYKCSVLLYKSDEKASCCIELNPRKCPRREKRQIFEFHMVDPGPSKPRQDTKIWENNERSDFPLQHEPAPVWKICDFTLFFKVLCSVHKVSTLF